MNNSLISFEEYVEDLEKRNLIFKHIDAIVPNILYEAKFISEKCGKFFFSYYIIDDKNESIKKMKCSLLEQTEYSSLCEIHNILEAGDYEYDEDEDDDDDDENIAKLLKIFEFMKSKR